MPRKVYMIDHLDCANCAAKMEDKINQLPQVEEAVLTFATRKLAITAQDPDALREQLQSIIRFASDRIHQDGYAEIAKSPQHRTAGQEKGI